MDEQDHHFFVGIVFSAFTVESLVNHFGNRIFKFWQEIEKITNIKAKIEILFERIGLEPNWGESPLQEINDCRCYRDYLAHSRPGTKMLSEAEQSSLSFEDVATQASRNPLVKERFKHMYENKVPSLEKLLKSVKELNKMILDNIEDIVKDENYPFDKEDDPLTSAVKVSLQGLKR
ncbi:MAG: hypothetical protein GY847_42020 [Proteobacteria bacterium]|nr:hypothetical protein [Pseudomonadota bacterium]